MTNRLKSSVEEKGKDSEKILHERSGYKYEKRIF